MYDANANFINRSRFIEWLDELPILVGKYIIIIAKAPDTSKHGLPSSNRLITV